MPFINALLFPVFDFVAKNRWAQIVLGLGIGWVIFMIYLSMRDSGVRRVEREKQKVREAEQRAAMVERKTEVIEKERINAQEAITARDTSGGYPDYDSLPESHKAIAEGRTGPR